MTEILIILLALTVLAALARVAWWAFVENDGYGRQQPPRSHHDSFAPPQRYA